MYSKLCTEVIQNEKSYGNPGGLVSALETNRRVVVSTPSLTTTRNLTLIVPNLIIWVRQMWSRRSTSPITLLVYRMGKVL